MASQPPTPNLRRRYARIITPSGNYQLTPSDVLWAARSAYFEGGGTAAVLWTETQRFILLRGSYPNFAQFVQAFSQPINPAWRRNGAFCRPDGQYASTDACSETRLQRRDVAASMSWSTLIERDPELVTTVLQWANGLLPNPVPRVTNFADPTVAEHWLAHNDGDVFVHDASDNVFIVTAASRAWDRNHVALHGADGSLANADGAHGSVSLISRIARVFGNALSQPLSTKV